MTSRSVAPTSRYLQSLRRIPSYSGPQVPPIQSVQAATAPAPTNPLEQVLGDGSMIGGGIGRPMPQAPSTPSGPTVSPSALDYMERQQVGVGNPNISPPRFESDWDERLASAQQDTFDQFLTSMMSNDPDGELQGTLDNIAREKRQLQEGHALAVEGINLSRSQASQNLAQELKGLNLSEDEVRTALAQFEAETELQLDQLKENYDLAVRQLDLQKQAAAAAHETAKVQRERGQLSNEEMQAIYDRVRAEGKQTWDAAAAAAAGIDGEAVQATTEQNIADIEGAYTEAEGAVAEGAATDLSAAALEAISGIVSAQRGDDVAVAEALGAQDLTALLGAGDTLEAQAGAAGALNEFNLAGMDNLSAASFQIADEEMGRAIEELVREIQGLDLAGEELDTSYRQNVDSMDLALEQAREDTDLALRGVNLGRENARLQYRQTLDDIRLAEKGIDLDLRHALEDYADAELDTYEAMRDALLEIGGGDRDEAATNLALAVATDVMGDLLEGTDPARKTVLKNTLMDIISSGIATGEASMAQWIDGLYERDPVSGEMRLVDEEGLEFIQTMTTDEFRSLVQGAKAYDDSWQRAYDTIDAAFNAPQANFTTTGTPKGMGSNNWANRNKPEYKQRAQLATKFKDHILDVFPNAWSAGQYRDISQAKGPGRDPDSDHLSGGAIDIRAKTHEEMLEIANYAKQYLGDAVGLVVYEGNKYHENDHVHISFNLGVGHYHADGTYHGPSGGGGGGGRAK